MKNKIKSSTPVMWAAVPSFDELDASSCGLIRLRKKRPRGRLTVGCVLSQSITSVGYPGVNVFTNDGRKVRVLVHRLVCEAFHGPMPTNRTTVNHRNGIKTDNRAENLEWASQGENNAHAYDTGLRSQDKFLTPAQVEEARDRMASGESQTSIAREFGCSRKTIGHSVNGRASRRAVLEVK